jgi:hypothetical protein
MKTYKVEWTCKQCSHQNEFSRTISDPDDWPNKFDDLECANHECGLSQDVRTRSCTITEMS